MIFRCFDNNTKAEVSNMEKKRKSNVWLHSLLLFVLFGVFTWAVMHVDVQPVGPNGSKVGLAALNSFVHNTIGVHPFWDHVTDLSGLIGLLTALSFAVLGVMQLVLRKSLRRIDRALIVLGGYDVVVVGVFLFFESHIVNYRPILVDGVLEASYPSTHAFLIVCIMGSAAILFGRMLPNPAAVRKAHIACAVVAGVTLIGRLLAGVHWLTDIVGGILLGSAMVLLFLAVLETAAPVKPRH